MSNQKGVLIKDGSGNVIDKRVYAGDTSKLSNQLVGLNYVILDDTDPVFVNATMPPPPPSLDQRITALESTITSISKQVGVSISNG